MENVTISKKIELELTADQWELYTNIPKAHDVAIALNIGMCAILNGKYNRIVKEEKICDLLAVFSEYGASDTEPRYVAFKLLEEMYS